MCNQDHLSSDQIVRLYFLDELGEHWPIGESDERALAHVASCAECAACLRGFQQEERGRREEILAQFEAIDTDALWQRILASLKDLKKKGETPRTYSPDLQTVLQRLGGLVAALELQDRYDFYIFKVQTAIDQVHDGGIEVALKLVPDLIRPLRAESPDVRAAVEALRASLSFVYIAARDRAA